MSPELASLTRIRSAHSWMRRSGKPLSEYPKRAAMTEREQLEAQQFAAGILPTPARWTLHLYELATKG